MSDLVALFDGNSLGHRAYHAMPRLWTYRGEPNHAVHGFGAMLLKALASLRPRYGAVAFDTPVPTFRHLSFAPYKAQRTEAPPDLYPQFGRIRQLAQALGLATVEHDGFEADDVLATLATQALEAGHEVVVVTSDSDALQLVGPGLRVLMPIKGISEVALYDEAGVRGRLGVAPSHVPALKALAGDTSDNIPGVNGIGAKTAARLIEEHGGLDGALAAAGIAGAADTRDGATRALAAHLAETLRAHVDDVRRNLELATVRRDVPVSFDGAACCLDDLDRAVVAARLRALGLYRLAERLPDPNAPPPPPKPKPKKAPPAPQLALPLQ